MPARAASFAQTWKFRRVKRPANREDIEVLYEHLPEPIDLDLDLANRMMYWTDRGDPPRGNTVNRAPMDGAPGTSKLPEIIFSHLMEGIGLALDLKGRAHVFDRLRRFRLQRESRWIESEDAALCPREPDRDRLRGTVRLTAYTNLAAEEGDNHEFTSFCIDI